VVECVENSFQFDAVGCVGTYIGHEKSCREVFCVSRGYYPCSRIGWRVRGSAVVVPVAW
jgi:hypothetical protein